MVAAAHPFRRLIGVDVSPACIEVARRNIARYGPDKIDPARIELLTLDAEDFEFPGDPMVMYLFNPFPGRVLERVVANLERSLRERPRQALIIYVNPHALAAITRSPTGCRWRQRGRRSTSGRPCSSPGPLPRE